MICAESVPPTVTRDESRCRGAHDAGAAGMALSDGYFGFFDGDFAAVVAAFATNGVIDVPCAAVGADSQCGGYGFVMCSAFCSAGFGLFAFRMCHFSLLLFRDLLQFRGHVSFRQTWSRVKKLCKGRQYLPLCQELNRKTFRRSQRTKIGPADIAEAAHPAIRQAFMCAATGKQTRRCRVCGFRGEKCRQMRMPRRQKLN